MYSRRMKSLWCTPFLALILVSMTSSAQAFPESQWFDFVFHGKKVGYLQAENKKTQFQGKPAIHIHRQSVITVRRQAEQIRMESTTDAWVTPEGSPLRFRHQRTEGDQKRSVEGDVRSGTLHVRMKLGSNVVNRELKLGADTYLASSLDVLFASKLSSQARWQGRAVLEEEGQVKDFQIRVSGTKQRSDGLAYTVEGKIAGMASQSLTLADGRALWVKMEALGAQFVATTREKAMAPPEAIDIFGSALFSADRSLPASAELKRLKVRLVGPSGKRPTYIPDHRQQVVREGPGFVELLIQRDVAPTVRATLPIRNASVSDYLKPTPFESLGEPQLVRTARKISGSEKNAWLIARRINAFVHGHILNKTLAHAFSTATEAYVSREGDCTEHAVLFSALAKILGLPTRLVTGLVYVGGPKRHFGYHEWVEVWVDKRWIAMDPTFGQDLADPTHIKLAQGQSDADGLRNAGMVAAGLIGDLKIEILDSIRQQKGGAL